MAPPPHLDERRAEIVGMKLMRGAITPGCELTAHCRMEAPLLQSLAQIALIAAAST